MKIRRRNKDLAGTAAPETQPAAGSGPVATGSTGLSNGPGDGTAATSGGQLPAGANAVINSVDPSDPDGYLALAQRTQADFENFRRRSRQDVDAASDKGVAKLAGELLTALDTFEHALAALEQQAFDPAANELIRGLSLVHEDFIAGLGRCGIEIEHPAGQAFDPTLHEAVAQVDAEGSAAGVVVEVHQSGYRIGSTLIRPARVSVAGA